MSRLYDLTLAVKGSKVKESIPYISNSLFRCGFDKFAMEVGKDDDNNQKLTVDIWKEICDETNKKNMFELVKVLSIGARNNFTGGVTLMYSANSVDNSFAWETYYITGDNESEIVNKARSVFEESV